VSQQVLEQMLSELQPLHSSEQQFLQEFFWLGLWALGVRVGTVVPSQLIPDLFHDLVWLLRPEEARTQLLSEIFGCLELELRAFLNICNKGHPLGRLQVTLSDSVFGTWGSSSAPTSSFLHTLLGNVLLLTKSNFNKCIVSVHRGRKPNRPDSAVASNPSSCKGKGSFYCSQQSERDVRAPELPKILGNWPSPALPVSLHQDKVQRGVSNAGANSWLLETVHTFRNSQSPWDLGYFSTDNLQPEYRNRNPPQDGSSGNVSFPFQPFFEGVKACLVQGVKKEGVSFQLAHSKQEFWKVIEKYPGKEVKRVLEPLYRTIHKSLSPEENLAVTGGVWQPMEQEFIQQYQEFEELIQRCSVGAGITLDFTMEDLLSYFSSITMS
ncbi:EXOC1 protein, partial [Polioptila caerulea]|nr:EXOC1 protein [Polioptila caerulea]